VRFGPVDPWPAAAWLLAAARRLRALVIAALWCTLVGLSSPLAQAQTPGTAPPSGAHDPELEARVLKLAAEFRCLVCQNQTIADSNADLAVDLRNQVREMLVRGETPQQITDYMTARYGDFVLYRPPVRSTTALLWYGPAALLVIGVLVLLVIIRRRSRLPADRFEPDPET
jgi:cytochrome c-type biogenesis protein CcmH